MSGVDTGQAATVVHDTGQAATVVHIGCSRLYQLSIMIISCQLPLATPGFRLTSSCFSSCHAIRKPTLLQFPPREAVPGT